MQVSIKADSSNTKSILALLEESGYSLPCNCHGARRCDGRQYSFDCAMIPKGDVTVTLPDRSGSIQGISLEDMSQVSGPGDTLLVDLGTTTVALALIERSTGKLRRRAVFANPQRTFGADVVSRIQASLQGQGPALKDCIRQAIEQQVSLLTQGNGQSPEELTLCLIGGNTAMIHLLMGWDCRPLSASPFALRERTPGPLVHGSCKILIFPWISAFVGGDITAGMLACRKDGSPDYLFVDLGTNGEMLLCHEGRMFAASTAAGPAFEGSGLSCGCPGVPGAITRVTLKRLQPVLDTIGNKLPVGICGSGAISLCKEVIVRGYADRRGILQDAFPEEGIRLGVSPDRKPLFFTPDDFRQVQTAVAAVAAGIETLCREAGAAAKQIPVLYLGGGFGFYLESEAYQTLHMFAGVSPDAVIPMGNTCLRGLFHYAVNEYDENEQPPFPACLSLPEIRTVSLADSDYFHEQFIRHMTYED